MHDTAGIRDEFGPEFEIVGELGRGGVSVVYLARDRMLGRQVAIKVIDDRYVGDAEALTRFRREARLLAQLQHPAIVPIHAARRLADGRVALVMQHMEGPTLRELIRREGPLPFAQVERVLRDVGEALEYLHRRGVVHRDVKPENIYVDPDGSRAYLADFGIAKPTDGDSGLTLTGVVLGTPTYMSPEQIDGAWLNGQSDLYSLGLVGWEMLTGRRPWAGEALYTVIYKQKNEYLPAVEQLRPGTPEHVREAVERALLKDRALRWPSAEAFVQQLATTFPTVPAGPAAAPVRLPEPPAYAEEDLPTQVIRPAAAVELWHRTAAVTEQRTHVRRRRTVAAAVAAALTLGGLTAGAAVFAKMSEDDSFVSFTPASTARPAPTPAPASPAPALPTPAAPAAAAPVVVEAPAPTPRPDSARAEAPPRAEPAETPRRAAPTPERTRRRRGPAAARTRAAPPARRPTPSPAPAPATPAPPAGEEAAPQPEAAAEPRLLGTPVNERVRTQPVRTLGAPRVRARGSSTPPSR